ncbi:glycosyltransferase family 2 protein [Spirosoma rigui]|uniref:glycosyltransferase family 2 protein n=1 Tax=Spirosoma rigui TaxID=564064 RepID=UPI0009B19C62|nr:glycosyltransferase family A protein [Spirosoma rigui]
MFSVVIPLFNKAIYIEKAVESVIQQTYADFELIIINDGSTDDSWLRVTKIRDSRITFIDQPNVGVSDSRNRGVKQARFEYIAFLDADDWWESTFLEQMSRLIQDYGEANLFGSNYYYVKHGKARVEPKGLPDTFRSGYINYIDLYVSEFCVLINCSFVVVRKQAFVQMGGFKSNLRFGEDIDLWIRLALTSKVAYLNKPLAYSNQDVDGESRAVGRQTLYSPEANFIFNLAYLKSAEEESAALKRLLDGLRVRVLLPYYLANQYVSEVRSVLAEVDFSQQPVYYRRAYALPALLVRPYFEFMKVGSFCKRTLIRLSRTSYPSVV